MGDLKVKITILDTVDEIRPPLPVEDQGRSGRVLAVADGGKCAEICHLDTVVSAVAVAAAGLLPDCRAQAMCWNHWSILLLRPGEWILVYFIITL